MRARGKILLIAVLLCVSVGFPTPARAQTLQNVLQQQFGPVAQRQTIAPLKVSEKSEAELERVKDLRDQIESISKNSTDELGEFLSDTDVRMLNENSEEAKGTLDLGRLGELLEDSLEIQAKCRSIKEATEAARQRAAEEAEQARREEVGRNIQAASYGVGSPGVRLCAAYVSLVSQAAGYGYPGGNANDMYWRWCVSESQADIRAGMMIAVSTHSRTPAGQQWGHVGIIVRHDDGSYWVRENIGYINERPLQDWIDYYSTTVPARWGWLV